MSGCLSTLAVYPPKRPLVRLPLTQTNCSGLAAPGDLMCLLLSDAACAAADFMPETDFLVDARLSCGGLTVIRIPCKEQKGAKLITQTTAASVQRKATTRSEQEQTSAGRSAAGLDENVQCEQAVSGWGS